MGQSYSLTLSHIKTAFSKELQQAPNLFNFKMADEFFWDNVRRFARSNMVTLLILAGVIGTAFLIFAVILVCTITNRKKIYDQYKKANNHRSNNTRYESSIRKIESNNNSNNLSVANARSNINQATVFSKIKRNEID